MRASPLARILLAVYVALAAYASLHPLQGWRDHGLSAFAYLGAPWPRYVTGFDVAADLLGYAPYGLLVVLALYPRVRGARAAAVALVSGAALSMLLEAAQSYLPARIASNLDLLFNAAGAAAGGALGVRLAPWLLERGPLKRLRTVWFAPGAAADLGLALLGLWLFTQLDPTTQLFGSGDLRDLFAAPQGPPRAPRFFAAIEAFTSGANLLAVALVFSALVAPRRPARAALLGLVAAALGVKTAALAILMRAENVFAWLTPGAQAGLVAGLAAAFVAVALPRTARLAAAAVLIMAATVLVNLAPPNPYLAATFKLWQQGHFLNFNGLTRLASAAWPFAALAYLILLASRRGREALG